MKISTLRLLTFALLVISLSSCGSKAGTGDSDGSSGGYISCVAELVELRNQGVIEATTEEIQEECRSRLLP